MYLLIGVMDFGSMSSLLLLGSFSLLYQSINRLRHNYLRVVPFEKDALKLHHHFGYPLMKFLQLSISQIIVSSFTIRTS